MARPDNQRGKKIKYFDYSDKNITLKRGEEMGRFNLGSTVIVLTTNKMQIAEGMTTETEIKLGQCLATPRDK